jgi:hypothetical protein
MAYDIKDIDSKCRPLNDPLMQRAPAEATQARTAICGVQTSGYGQIAEHVISTIASE